MICDQCGKDIYIGEDIFTFDQTRVNFAKDRNFCSYECVKKYAEENLEDLLDELIQCEEVVDEDPYDRYGVSRGDF